jgi:hypothetical protein
MQRKITCNIISNVVVLFGRTIMKVVTCAELKKWILKKNELLMKWKVEAYIWMRRGSIPKGNKSVQTILES